MRRAWFLILAALFTTSSFDSASGARLVLQQGLHGYAGAQDTWLDEYERSANYGGATSLVVRYDASDGGFIEDCTLVRFTLPSVVHESLSNAVLDLFYFYAGDLLNDNAIGIKPYRLAPSKTWYENDRTGGTGEGANWRYFGQAETSNNEWTAQSGGWYDKLDDGNPSNLLKETGGSVPNAIEPTNWVPFDITRSVRQWLSGATNNGVVLFSCSFQGTGNDGYVRFSSREATTATQRPRLRLFYTGAHLVWSGLYGNVWDTTSTNWSVGGFPGCYDDGDHVWFTDSAAQTNIVLTSARSPGSVTISNSTSVSFVLSGAPIGGTGSVEKAGAGRASLGSSNNYIGLTLIREGMLVVHSNGALGRVESGTLVESNGTLGLSACDYSAAEPLMLRGALRALTGSNRWVGPVTFDGEARVQASVETSALLDLTGELAGTGDVEAVGGTVRFTGSTTSSWSGSLSVASGALLLGRDVGPVFGGDLTVGGGGYATAVVLRADQWASDQRVMVRAFGTLSFATTDGVYSLNRLVLQGGAVDSGPTRVRLAETVTVWGASYPATLQGVFELAHTGVVFDVEDGTAAADLVVAGSLTNGNLRKTGFGKMVLLGANDPSSATEVVQGGLAIGHPIALGGQPLWVGGEGSVYLATNGTWSNELVLMGALWADADATATWSGLLALGTGTCTLGATTGACLMLDTTLDTASARLSFRGGGEVKLFRAAHYGGGTVISGVTVTVCNGDGSALGTGGVNVYANGTLKGTGIVHAPVILAAGATLMPGGVAGQGTLTISNTVTFLSNSLFSVAQTLSTHSVLDLANGGMLNVDTNAIFIVNSSLLGSNPVVFVRGATELKGHFAGLPSGAPLPWPNSRWHIHYQPNGIYVSTNARPIVYFRALDDEGHALVSWRTPIELDVVGFDLYREDGGMWQKVNDTPISATYPEGGVYFFTDPGVPPGVPARYQLVQLLANGQSNVLVVCDRMVSSMKFMSISEPGALKTVVRWRSREDEHYWLEWLPYPDTEVRTNWGPIPATPEENSYEVNLPEDRGLFRIRWSP